MLPLRARVDLGAMAMKGYSAFPKAPALLEPHHQIVYCHIQDTRWGVVLPLCREEVGVFYSPSRLGKTLLWNLKKKITDEHEVILGSFKMFFSFMLLNFQFYFLLFPFIFSSVSLFSFFFFLVFCCYLSLMSSQIVFIEFILEPIFNKRKYPSNDHLIVYLPWKNIMVRVSRNTTLLLLSWNLLYSLN